METFGLDVEWDEESDTVIIDAPQEDTEAQETTDQAMQTAPTEQ